tara:strand:- start:367 stop:2163 length:1797 start_codon:yes stop_codon:yes gene_type:complete
MAATNYTPIQLYYSATAAAIPVNTNLVAGELAINTADGLLFYKDSGGTVQKIGYKLTPTTAGGTGLTSFTANGVVYASSTSALATGSALVFDGTNLLSTGGATFQGGPTGYGGGEVRLGTTAAGQQSAISTLSTASPVLNFDHRGTGNTGIFAWRNGTGAASTLMYLDASGNLGLGVTPSAWASYKSVDVITGGAGLASSGQNCYLTTNAYYNAGWKYKLTTIYGVSWYEQFNGQHAWFSAPSGTAGNAISATQAMTLDSSGRLGIGQTSPISFIDVYGNGAYTYARFYRSDEAGYGGRVGNGNTLLGAAGTRSLGLDGFSSINFGIAGSQVASISSNAYGVFTVGNQSSVGGFGTDYATIGAWSSAGGGYRIYRGTGAGTAICNFYADSGGVNLLALEASAPLIFGTAGAEKARIDSSGNLLVGDTSAYSGSRLSVKTGNNNGTTHAWYAKNSSATLLGYQRDDGLFNTGAATNSPYNFTTATAANLFVDASGTFYRSTSSLKYKTNVQNATHGLADLLKLRSVTYKGKNDGDKVYGGLIAEEIHEAGLTEFVQYAEDGTPDALNYGNMVSLCIKAIQEQQALITQLTARITALEGA